MEDDEELVRPGVGLRDVDDDERDASLASCHRIFKDMSGFLFAKRDGAVDTSDFIQQLMKGYYDGCTKAGARMPRPSIEVRLGAKIFVENCASCHTAEPGGGMKVGPNLVDVADRPVASSEDFMFYSHGLRPNGGYADDDKDEGIKGYSKAMLAYAKEQGGWTDGVLDKGTVVHLGKGRRDTESVNLEEKMPLWTQKRFCDFVYDPQGVIPKGAMGKKHVELSGFQRHDWCPMLWKFFVHTRTFTSLATSDRGTPGMS